MHQSGAKLMELTFCGKRNARTVLVCRNYARISLILWKYVLIWYSCGGSGLAVKSEGIRMPRNT